MITRESLRTELVKLWERNQYFLAPDMKRALKRARDGEESELARPHFTINLTSPPSPGATSTRGRHFMVSDSAYERLGQILLGFPDVDPMG